MKTKTIFLDGKMVKARSEIVDALAPGIVQGIGVFETMLVLNGTIYALDKHFHRLFRGLKLLNIRSPYSKKQWIQYLYKTLKTNSLSQARIRLAVWREQRQVHISIVCQNIQDICHHKNRKNFKAIISNIGRKKTRFSNIKSLDYSRFHKAYSEAKRRGYDEAILLNNRKEVVEGSRTNIFYIKNEVLYTPMIKCGCLNGITRQFIVKYARAIGIAYKTIAFGVYPLLQADEAFMTNSLIGIVPLTKVENQNIAHGKVGKITKMIQNMYYSNLHSACSVINMSV